VTPAGAPPSGPPAERRVRALVTGRVQGVGFRASVQEVARRLGLGGWVRNLADGRVELEAEGPAAAIAELAAWLHRGPALSRVDSVDVEERGVDPAAPLPRPFQLRRDGW
jgi:acylphosphatase